MDFNEEHAHHALANGKTGKAYKYTSSVSLATEIEKAAALATYIGS